MRWIGDPRIAGLVAGQDAVTAVGDAGSLDQRTDVAALDLAGRRAAVVAVGVAVVALLGPLDRAVAAADLGADALHARDARAAGALDLAVARTAVALCDVAVVAHLVDGRLHDAIPAARRAHARRAGRRADPPLLEIAVRAATVARRPRCRRRSSRPARRACCRRSRIGCTRCRGRRCMRDPAPCRWRCSRRRRPCCVSSHTSPAPIMPSPQAVFRVHAPAEGQVQFGSTWQMPLQPSPATVLPSSQASMPPWLLMPSPQPGGTGSVPPAPVALAAPFRRREAAQARG